MERGDLCEVSQVAVDGAFGVVGLLLNFGEGVCLEIQLEKSASYETARAPCRVSPPRVMTKYPSCFKARMSRLTVAGEVVNKTAKSS